jgi:hypothetical protein
MTHNDADMRFAPRLSFENSPLLKMARKLPRICYRGSR